MSPEKQRIKIAEACGWTEHEYGDGGLWGWLAPGGVHRPGGWRTYYNDDELPDYLTDLNAMHEAVDSVLVEAGRKGDWRGWDSYVATLTEMVGSEGAIEAAAAQRAEAFVRTIGKWEESP